MNNGLHISTKQINQGETETNDYIYLMCFHLLLVVVIFFSFIHGVLKITT